MNLNGVKALNKKEQKRIFGGVLGGNNGLVCCEWIGGSGSVVTPYHVCIEWVTLVTRCSFAPDPGN